LAITLAMNARETSHIAEQSRNQYPTYPPLIGKDIVPLKPKAECSRQS
jgi:hypothetical protein